MKTPLAWRNIAHNKARSLVALCGVGFAIVLIFMQLGFYAAARSSATNVYDALDFDLVVVSPQYVFMAHPGQFPRSRLEQLPGLDGVEVVMPLWIELGEWRNGQSRHRWNVLTLGVELGERPFRSATMNDQLPRLTMADRALADNLSRRDHGPLDPGVRSELQHHRMEIVGQYAIGAGFMAGATMVTSRETFLEVFNETASRQRINVGLVKLRANVPTARLATEINRQLWPEARAMTRPEITRAEQRFWLSVKPIGIMFTSGVCVALVAGAVILYQVLANEVQNRLREYATLKALGYDDRYVYGAVLRQAFIFSILGFVPAFFLAHVIYFVLRTKALVPVTMEPGRVAAVFLLTTVMCATATFLAVRKLREAHPAELF